jgi:hypothetical protein
MITSREHYTGKLFTITTPTDLSSKPGVVLATEAHYEPNYMSMPGDRWVSSNGTILTCEQLFDALSKRDTDTKLVWLTDYDFQGMYETDLTTQHTRMGRLVEEQEVPVYDPHLDAFTHIPYGELLKTGTVVYFKGRKHFFCVEFGLPLLEGSWVDEEGSCRATAEFLFYVLNEDEAITLVNK